MNPQSDPFGIGILSRLPTPSMELFRGGGGMTHARAVVVVEGMEVEILSVHPVAPERPSNSATWSKEIDAFAELGPGRRVLGGDLNMTPTNWSHRRLLRALGARDAFSACGRGWLRTFPAVLPLGRLDHVFLGEGIHCRSIETGSATGSDHLAVYAVLEVSR